MATFKVCKRCGECVELGELECLKKNENVFSQEGCILEKIRNESEKNSVFAINTFDGLSPDEKRKMLKKRSDEHYEREIKERKIQMNRDLYKE